MGKNSYFTKCCKTVFLLISFILLSCTDNSFSFDEIDGTIGLGADELVIWNAGSTDELQMDDILDLNGSDFINIASNGDYVLSVAESDPNTTVTEVDEIVVNTHVDGYMDINVDFSSAYQAANRRTRKKTPTGRDAIFVNHTIAEFEYKTSDVPNEIVSMKYLSTSAQATITMTFDDNFLQVVNKIGEIKFAIPRFLNANGIRFNGKSYPVSSDNTVVFYDIQPKRQLVFTTNITGLDIENKGESGEIEFIRGKLFRLKDVFTMEQVIYKDDIAFNPSVRTSTISCLTEVDNAKVTSVTGTFDISVDYDKLATTTLGNIPDFLSDEDVKVSLYDPRIDLTVHSGLPIDATASAVIHSYNKEGNVLKTVNVPSFPIKHEAENNISIRGRMAEEENVTVVHVPTLGSLIETIPHKIDFTNVKAKSIQTQETTIQLGHKYEVSACYKVNAPIAFNRDAVITYNDTITDLHDVLRHLRFKENVDEGNSISGLLRLEADVENKLPLHLSIEATALNSEQKPLSDDIVRFEIPDIVEASSDGLVPSTSHITISIIPLNNKMFEQMDAIAIRFIGKADTEDGNDPIEGIVLNAYSQTLLVKDVVVTKKGKLIGDFN